MKWLPRWRLTIRQKMLVGFLIVICICVAAMTTIATRQISRVVDNKVSQYNQQIVNKTLENIEYYLQDVSELAKNMALDEQILHAVRSVRSDGQNVKSRQQLDNFVKKYQFLKSYITDISIFDENRNVYYSFDYDYKNPFFEEGWYQSYHHFSGENYFSGIHPSIIRGTSIEGIPTFSYLKKVYDLADPTEYMYTVVIEMDYKVLSAALHQLNSSDEWTSLIFNEHQETMLTQTEESLSAPEEAVRTLLESDAPSPQKLHLDGHAYLAMRAASAKYGWHLISLAPYSRLMGEASGLRYDLFLAGAICVLLAAVISMLISKGISVPLAKLMGVIRELEKGNFHVTADIRSGDEIERLSGVLNRMASGMETLLEQNVREEKLKRQAELTALQAQINPHFLYNTLESMNWFAVRKKEMEISDVLTNLGKFFRISLSGGSAYIPLSQEAEHVRSYINIQRFRYSNRFESEITIDAEAMTCYVPKLILQPLVENALIHAFKDKNGAGIIRITARREENLLLLTVSDDGSGMREEQLAQIEHVFRGEARTGKVGYGLSNIQDRIRLSFGEAYGLSIHSAKDSGTSILLRLPAIQHPPQDET